MMEEKVKDRQWGNKRERFFAKFFGIMILREPDKNWPHQDPVKDAVMLFHYCKECKDYRFDRFLDPLSISARFTCEGCGTVHGTNELSGYPGLLFFMLWEYYSIAFSSDHIKAVQLLLFLKFLFFGLGKYIPGDRGGKTAGELEIVARQKMIFTFVTLLS